MSEMNRVQRWRQQQREAGKETLTVWLPREMRLYIEDMALKRRCSPSDLIQQALTTCYPLSADVAVTVTDTSVADTIVTDTSQIRSILQQELRAFFGDSPPYQGVPPVHGVTDTIAHAESVAAAPPETWSVTDTVTATVTDTVTDIHGLPVPEAVMDHQGEYVTDTVTDTHIQAQDVTAAAIETPLVTETVSETSAQTEAERVAIRALHGVTDTITDTQSEPSPYVTDTVTDTGHTLEPFDTSKFYLGKLCPKGHDFDGTGQSLRRQHNMTCRECQNESRREKRQAKRQAAPAD